MQSLIKSGFATILFCGFIIQAYAGGGWPQPKKHGYIKLGQYAIRADQYFDPSGNIIPITTTGFYATSIYAEYGFTEKLTGTVYFPFFVRSTLNRVETANGDLFQESDFINSIGDADVSLKYSLTVKNGWVSAVQVTFGLPLGESMGGSTMLLQTGDGEFNQMVTGHLSRSFGSGNTYASAYGGFNNRTNNFSDEIRWGLEGGISTGNFWFIARLYAIHSLKNGDSNAISGNGIFNNNVEFVAWSPEINYNITEKFGISASAGFALSGKRVLANPAYSAGLFLEF